MAKANNIVSYQQGVEAGHATPSKVVGYCRARDGRQRGTDHMKSLLAFIVAVPLVFITLLGPVARADESPTLDATGLPALVPVSSTSFICKITGDTSLHIIAVVISFPDGSVVRFDKQHQHNVAAETLEALADAAPDSAIYTVECRGKTVST